MPEDVTVGFGNVEFRFPLAQVIDEGLVVFVDEDHHMPARFFTEGRDQLLEQLLEQVSMELNAMSPPRIFEAAFHLLQAFRRIMADFVEIQQDHRVFLPFPVGVFGDPQPLEQVSAPFEEAAQSRNRQGLAETSRAGQEIVFSLVRQPKKNDGFCPHKESCPGGYSRMRSRPQAGSAACSWILLCILDGTHASRLLAHIVGPDDRPRGKS